MQLHPSMRRTLLEELCEMVGAEFAPRFLADFESRLPLLIHEGITAQQALSKVNYEARHRGVEGLGQCMVRWAPQFKRVVCLLFGSELAAEEKFLREIEKDNCYVRLKPAYALLPRIVHPGLSEVEGAGAPLTVDDGCLQSIGTITSHVNGGLVTTENAESTKKFTVDDGGLPSLAVVPEDDGTETYKPSSSIVNGAERPQPSSTHA